MRVFFYTTPSGRRPVEEFIQQLPFRLQASILLALERVEEEGLDAPGVSFRQIRDKLWEIRIRAGGAARIFYVVRREKNLDRVDAPEVDLILLHAVDAPEVDLILLHAYLKKTQKAPPREIQTAERRMKEVLG